MDPITIYFGLSLGFSSSAMNSGSEPDPYPVAAAMKIVNTGLSGRGYVGIRYKQIAAEIGAGKLGNFQQSRQWTNPSDDVTGDIIRTKEADIRIKGFLPLTDKLEVYGYVAPTEVFWHREYWVWQNLNWSVQDGHNYSTGFGVGANYNLSKHSYISMEAGHNQAIGLSINSVQVGFGYKF